MKRPTVTLPVTFAAGDVLPVTFAAGDVLAARESALRDAAAAMCGSCKSDRKLHRGQFATVRGQVYHFYGTLEYTNGATRDFCHPCKAGPIQTLLDAVERDVENDRKLGRA